MFVVYVGSDLYGVKDIVGKCFVFGFVDFVYVVILLFYYLCWVGIVEFDL